MGPPLSQPATNNRTFCNERSLLGAPKYLGRRSREVCPGGKLSPRGHFRHGALEEIMPGAGQWPSGGVGLAARSRRAGPAAPGGAGRCAAAPAPCPTQPGRPSSPRHKAHCPYSFGLCSHMANPCRHSQHPFIQAHNVPQQGTIGTLFASIIDANGRQRERERKKKII